MKARLFALFFISAIEFIAALALPHVPRNDLYFAACGAINFCTLLVFTVMGNDRLMVDLAGLTFAQLCIQFGGWVLYSMYLPAHLYNWGINFIVVATYVRIFWIGAEGGNFTSHLDRRLFPGNAFQWTGYTFEAHKKWTL